MAISESTKKEVYNRSGYCCEAGCPMRDLDPPHHVFAKSQYYEKDRDEAWNLASLCRYHHRIIHFSSKDSEVKEKNELDYFLKFKALALRPYGETEELKMMVKRAKLKL